ncbi:hypothetical protein ACNJYA_08955 [Bradyrhizobium sp. DASA03068]|uniref:hypothetical protein n=1 Tax=Bradyrhizobium sp. BLXBL-01 TaxID=3395915 RepID=UPI003F6FBAE6
MLPTTVQRSAARYAAEGLGLSVTTTGKRRFVPKSVSIASGHAARPTTNGFAGCERLDTRHPISHGRRASRNSSEAIIESGVTLQRVWANQAAENSATIIDFNAYRMKKGAAARPSPDAISSIAPYEVAAAICFFWSLLALIPFGTLDWPASEQEPS